MSDEVGERTEVTTFDNGNIIVRVDGYIRYAGDRNKARLLANAILQEADRE